MTLNAREAMQALLDGKTLKCEYADKYYKLDDTNLLHKNRDGWHVLGDWTLSYMDVYDDEYPLDFEQALRAMLDGKIVMRESSDEHEYRFRNGMFESSTEWDRFTRWEPCTMFTDVQTAKWKVVE